MLPLSLKDGDDRALVKTEVKLPNSQPVPVNYSFVLSDDGKWRIYDVKIDGISWVINYRTSYDPIIQARGLDALIDDLAQSNTSDGT